MESRKNERILSLEIYTDGSLKKIGSQTFGGWAFIAVNDSKEVHSDSGCEYSTTNQRMELTAIAKALEYAKENRPLQEKAIIYSDSAYAINCYLQEWYKKWMNNGWVNSKGEDVANKDLWLKIIPFFDNFWYSFKKVKGHNNVFWNEKCDELAQSEAEYIKINWRN